MLHPASLNKTARKATLATLSALLLPLATPADCTDVRQGAFFGAMPENHLVNINCWMVSYTDSTAFVDSNDAPITLADFHNNDDAKAIGCLAGSTLAADKIIRLTPVAPACTDVRDGSFFPGGTANEFFVTCWRVTHDAHTVFVNSQNQSITFGDILMGDHVQAFGCIQPDFSMLADRVVLDTANIPGAATSDARLSMGSGTHAYVLQACTDPGLGTTDTNNPTLTLEIGKRYFFSYGFPDTNPLCMVTRGVTSNLDDYQLTQGAGFGNFEFDPDVHYLERGTDIEFTLTQGLADAMSGTGNQSPGYRSQLDSLMRGAIVLKPIPTTLAWPAGSEDFEGAARNTRIESALAGWQCTTTSPAAYGAKTQLAGGAPSPRWVLVNDQHDSAAGDDVIVSPAVAVPSGTFLSRVAWDMKLRVTQVAPGTHGRIVSQALRDSASAPEPIAGIEYTHDGVDAVIVGQDDGGIGRPGGTIRVPVYRYSDSPSLGLGTWVPLHFELNSTGQLIVTYGATSQSVTTPGLDPSLWCTSISSTCLALDNSGPGNTSQAGIDAISFSALAPTAGVEGWTAYE